MMDVNQIANESNREKKLNRTREELLLLLLTDCLKLKFFKRNVVFEEYTYLLDIRRYSTRPLTQLIEDRIFQLEKPSYDDCSGMPRDHVASRVKFNKKLLVILNAYSV
jgi:hypothetical protein